MKRYSCELAGLCFAVSVFAYTCANASDTHFQSIWSMRLGDTGEDRLRDVAVDQAGNMFVTGYFVSHTNVGGSDFLSVGSWDIVVAKYNPDGAHLWSTRFGSTGLDAGFAATVDLGGNLYVAGVFNGTVDFGGGPLTSAGSGDIFVASFASDGAHRWSRRYGSFANDTAQDIAVTNAQDLIITGFFRDSVDFGGGALSAESIDAFVLALDTDGNHIWSTRHGGSFDELGVELAIDHDDNVYLAASYSVNTAVTSSHWTTHLVKFDANGGHIWFRIPQLGPTPPVNYLNTPWAVAIDSEGNVFLAGRLYGDAGNTEILQSSFLNKVSPAGDSIWLRFYPETVPNQSNMLPALTEIVLDESDRLIIAGRIEGAGDLGGGPLGDTGDVFLARLDSDGNHDVSVGFPGSVSELWQVWPGAIDLLPSGELVLAGQFEGTLDLGDGTMTSLGTDMFMARIDVDVSLAVAITSFFATGTPTGVELHAKFQSNLDVTGVNVYRATGTTDPFERIASLVDRFEGAFEYVDRSVRPGKTYRYMIGVVDEDGEFISPVVEAKSSALGAELLQNVPNPFNPRTTISFTVPEREVVSLVVFDTRGGVVRVLVADELDFGRHDVEWDGLNDAGLQVSSGVYYCRLRAGAFVGTRKMVLLK